MMQSNYQPVFGVTVLHSYFEQQVCKCLQFQPSQVTNKLFKKFDCIMRKSINGFELYINSKQSVSNVLNYMQNITGQTFFEFDITTTDDYFISFTDLPVDWLGTIMYNSEDVVRSENTVQLNAQLINNDAPSATGNLKIHFSDIADYQQFNINFSARSTQWNYFFINKNSVLFDAPAIAKSEFDFGTPQQVTIANGEQATMFSSGESLIPLSENPKYKFDLVNNSSATRSPKILFKGLPNPDVKRSDIVKVKGQKQFSSPMYIYL